MQFFSTYPNTNQRKVVFIYAKVEMSVAKTLLSLDPKLYILQSWALALFFQIHSQLIFYPWIAIALLLILRIFRFAHRSISL